MSIIRVGTSKKYSEGWESAFGKKGAVKTATKSKVATAISPKARGAKAVTVKLKKAGAKKGKK